MNSIYWFIWKQVTNTGICIPYRFSELLMRSLSFPQFYCLLGLSNRWLVFFAGKFWFYCQPEPDHGYLISLNQWYWSMLYMCHTLCTTTWATGSQKHKERCIIWKWRFIQCKNEHIIMHTSTINSLAHSSR